MSGTEAQRAARAGDMQHPFGVRGHYSFEWWAAQGRSTGRLLACGGTGL